MIERIFDAEIMNSLANDPSILPWITIPGNGRFDMTEMLADRRNYALFAGLGAFFLHNVAPGEHEVHSMFLPEARGEYALNAAREGIDYMFRETDCHTIWGRCPKGNLAVLAFARALKLEYVRTDKNAWPSANGMVDQKWFRMTRDRWNDLNNSRRSQCH